MIGPSLYILVSSGRNRTRQRLRRLREPRYLFGAIAGIAYLVFTLVIRQRAYRLDRAGSGASAAAGAVATLFGFPGVLVGSVLLACAAAATWAMPFTSGLLDFTRAETSFLFPAPLTRPQLVMHRLLRSQAAVFTGALIMALAYPTGSMTARLRGLIAVWVVLMTSHVFFTGVTLARAHLRSGRRGLFVWPAVALTFGAVGTLAWAVLDAASHASLETTASIVDVIAAAAEHGATRLFLWPFAVLVRPLFAPSLGGFLSGLAGAIVVYAVCLCWVIWADASSSDIADASAERQVNQPARQARVYVARPIGWRLALSGRDEWLFVWKGVLQTFRTVDRRLLVRVLIVLVWMIAVSLLMSRARGLAAILGIFATWAALFSAFMGPQILRMDMRDDLAHLALIRTWPLRGASVIRGEIIWPAIVVSTITWICGLTAMSMSMTSVSRIASTSRVAGWLAFAVLTPGVVLAQYTVHNMVAVLFPAWVPTGTSRLRGVDAVGQRLILLAGNWIALLIALAPGIIVTLLLALWLRPVVGAFVLPIGALVTTAMVVVEMWFVAELLGPVFERLDVTSVERPD